MISNPMIAKLRTVDGECYGIIHGHGPPPPCRLSLVSTYPTWDAAHTALVALLDGEVEQLKQDLGSAVANLYSVMRMGDPNAS